MTQITYNIGTQAVVFSQADDGTLPIVAQRVATSAEIAAPTLITAPSAPVTQNI